MRLAPPVTSLNPQPNQGAFSCPKKQGVLHWRRPGEVGCRAYLLTQRGWLAVVFEANRRYLGGTARTVEHNGFRCDIGGHRFFPKSAEVNRRWEETLGNDLRKLNQDAEYIEDGSSRADARLVPTEIG